MKRPDGWDELYLEAYRKEHASGALYGSPERAMFEAGADAQAKVIADAIDSMTADGWWLEDIVKAIREVE